MSTMSQDLRDSVTNYRDPKSSELDRQLIRSWWLGIDVPNQLAALRLAEKLEKESDR